MKYSFYISELISKEIKGSISVQEKKDLEEWVNKSSYNLSLYKAAIDKKSQLEKLKSYQNHNSKRVWDNIENELFKSKTIQLFSRKFMKYAAAILIPLLLAGGAGYIYFNGQNNNEFAQLDSTIKPGVQKATLISSKGEKVELGSNMSISLNEEDVQISDEDNVISYTSAANLGEFEKVVYNELITPFGGGYKMILADGTSVWLNAGSKLKFPVSFTDSTRQVFLEGEAFFEVAHNGLPFIVSSGEMDVRVMGTSFNISAYPEDAIMKTTLAEGKVRVDYHEENLISESKFLTPNNQAIVQINNPEIKVEEVNASQYTSWVDGRLEFNNETLEQVMKRLARWYNFKYEFENTDTKGIHFSGRLDDKEKISAILDMLEMTTDVNFIIKEEKIIIQ